MSNARLVIKKLILQGPEKKDAILTFSLGLNIVAGASDTGKSFAFECINYILGATNLPEIPNEAKGYDKVLLELLLKESDQTITLCRSLYESEKSKIHCIYADSETKHLGENVVLSSDSKAKNSLSSKLMEWCDCSYRNILKTLSGNTERFTFRKFVYLSMLNETRIVQKNSPIFMGDTHRDKTTKETAALFTVLSGTDYEKYIKPESPEVKKARLKGAVDELSIMCDELRLKINGTEEKLNGFDSQSLNNKIHDLDSKIKEQQLIIEEKETEKSQLVEKSD